MTWSNGIAVSGPPQDLARRLEQAAAIARAAARLLQEPLRHLPDGLDPWAWIVLGTDVDSPEEHNNTLCRTPGITVADPHRVTCGDCITVWNTRWHGEFAFPVTLRIPDDPADCRIGDQLPYASITWIGTTDDGNGQDPLPDPDENNISWISVRDKHGRTHAAQFSDCVRVDPPVQPEDDSPRRPFDDRNGH